MSKPTTVQRCVLNSMAAGKVIWPPAYRYGSHIIDSVSGDLLTEAHTVNARTVDGLRRHGWIRFDDSAYRYRITDAGRAALTATPEAAQEAPQR